MWTACPLFHGILLFTFFFFLQFCNTAHPGPATDSWWGRFPFYNLEDNWVILLRREHCKVILLFWVGQRGRKEAVANLLFWKMSDLLHFCFESLRFKADALEECMLINVSAKHSRHRGQWLRSHCYRLR